MEMEHLPPPHRRFLIELGFDEMREAVEKSRAALLNLSSSTSTPRDLLIKLADTTKLKEWKKERGAGEVWDTMLDVGDAQLTPTTTTKQFSLLRMAILRAAANLTGQPLHLLLQDEFNVIEEEEKERVLVEALSLAADRHLLKLLNVENLFLVDTTTHYDLYGPDYELYGPAERRRAWEWGSRDMMFDFRDATPSQRMAILTAAANLTGGAVHFMAGQRGCVEALSLAADRDAAPSSLLIFAFFHVAADHTGLLSALKKNKRLKHLSLYHMEISDECVEVLCDFTSLTSLHLHSVFLSSESEEEFLVGRLAELHPSHSPLAASLQRLHINYLPIIDWRRSTGFLRHWPQLKELSLESSYGMKEEEVMDFMDQLAPPKKGAETAGSTLPSSPPQLYNLELRYIVEKKLSRSATATVVDALSRSGLPFLEFSSLKDPAIEVQLWRNQRNYMLGSDLKRVPATSIRLFICGDPFAGKTTLVTTMRSMYGRKRDWLKTLITRERTKGIEVQAIKKEGIRVSLWDMAGQQEFHAFHDCMFPDIGTSSYQFPSMFVFVWSPMDSENSHRGAEKKETDFETSFRYWLQFLASKSRQSKIPLRVIVVFTRADQMEFVTSALLHSIDSLRRKFREVIDILQPPFHVDARQKDSVKAVAESVFSNAKDMLQGIQLYDVCTQVSKHLSKHLKNKNERIITWEKFTEICDMGLQHSNSTSHKAKLNAIAMSLNESGNIIYINGIQHIVLDPHWFCNEIMGTLIHYSNSKGDSKVKGTIVFEKGYIPKRVLEEKFESITKSKAEGSLLVQLMESMQLCCKVPDSSGDKIFIPAILSNDVDGEQLQWTSKCESYLDDNNGMFVYMGRRLECKDNALTFLTPGLFPQIQVLFNNIFQSQDDEAEVTLGKDFISIFFQDMEIIVVFCQAKSNHVIDVLVRAHQNINNEKHALNILAFVQKHIINTVIKICAQPSGVQGVTLIESVIRPDCLCDPSRAQDREGQCLEITYLKKELWNKLEQSKEKSYVWKMTKLKPHYLKSDLIDLLGSEHYEEVLWSFKQWLAVVVRDELLEEDDKVNESGEYQSSCENVIMTSLEENGFVQEGQTLEEVIKFLARSILSLHHKVDVIHEEVLKVHDKMDRMTKKLDEMHKEIQYMRKDVMSNVEKSTCKLLKMALENEAEKQLPCVALLTIKYSASTIEELLTWVPKVLGGKIVRIQLYCEDRNLIHPVENHFGITLTSLSDSQRETLERALPYIKGFFGVLSIATRLCISFVAPLASSLVPNCTPHIELPKQYPMIQRHTEKSKKDMFLSTLECASKEWQKCLASILRENGGLTDENIEKKFGLRRARYNQTPGSTQVAWLCERHFKGKTPFPLG